MSPKAHEGNNATSLPPGPPVLEERRPPAALPPQARSSRHPGPRDSVGGLDGSGQVSSRTLASARPPRSASPAPGVCTTVSISLGPEPGRPPTCLGITFKASLLPPGSAPSGWPRACGDPGHGGQGQGHRLPPGPGPGRVPGGLGRRRCPGTPGPPLWATRGCRPPRATGRGPSQQPGGQASRDITARRPFCSRGFSGRRPSCAPRRGRAGRGRG